MKNIKNILITGASSGIGAALALLYAKPGTTLGLMSRSTIRLEAIAGLCRKQGAEVYLGLIDITDATSTRKWITDFDATHPVDLVIANAGISAGSGGIKEPEDQVRAIFAVNLEGVLNTVQPLIAPMSERGHGQIAIISSLAGMRGLPSTPAYSASKAAVRVYGEALRGLLAKQGVKVSVVCPGYIRTPMTAVNNFPMPFLMEPEEAAVRIAQGLARNRSRIAFPKRLYIPLWLLSCLSPSLTDWFFARLPSKDTA